MKYIYLSLIAVLGFTAISCKSTCKSKCAAKCEAKCEKKVTETDSVAIATLSAHEKTSYALAFTLANDMETNGIDSIDFNQVEIAFDDVFNQDTARLTRSELDQIMRDLTNQIREKKRLEDLGKYDGNKSEGERFMAEMALNDSVVKTASGLMYKIIRKGDGNKPIASDEVSVHYEGKLINGKIFDSSYKRNSPANFPLNRVIPGWTEGLQYVSQGGAILLYIPYNLAYGESGSGQNIPPFSTLIFKVELLEIVDAHKGHNHAPGAH